MTITVNGATNTISASGTVTVPALTLGGAITGGGQNVSGLGTLACGDTAVTGTLSATGAGATTSMAFFGTTDYGALSSASREVHIQNGTASFLVLGSALSAYGFLTHNVADDAMYLQYRGATNQIKLGSSGLTTIGGTGNFGLAVTGTLSATGITSVTDVTDATSTTAASLKTAGGLGVAKAAYLGSHLVMASEKYIYLDGGGDTAIRESSANVVDYIVGGATTLQMTATALNANQNIVMASGKGIDFSATSNGSGTTTSEVLSDYEEGTWTPAIGVNGFDGAPTPSGVSGAYTKVGRLVTVSLSLTFGAGTYPSTYCVLTGLPFTPATDYSTGSYGNGSAGSGAVGGTCQATTASQIVLFQSTPTTASITWFATVTYHV